MTKNPIQEKRMKEYFLQAAQEIIRAEGIRALNVRTVAERAGYSFATLYNYYDDFKELVYSCVGHFLDECGSFIADSVKRNNSADSRLKKVTKAYINYFIQYPGTFELIFMERMTELNNDKVGSLITDFRERIFNDSETGIANDCITTPEIYFNLVNGTLMMYFFRRTPGSYKEFVTIYEKILGEFAGAK